MYEDVFGLIERFKRVVFPLFHSALKDIESLLINVAKDPGLVLFQVIPSTVQMLKGCTTTTQEAFAFRAPVMNEYFFQHLDLFHQFASHHVRQ